MENIKGNSKAMLKFSILKKSGSVFGAEKADVVVGALLKYWFISPLVEQTFA